MLKLTKMKITVASIVSLFALVAVCVNAQVNAQDDNVVPRLGDDNIVPLPGDDRNGTSMSTTSSTSTTSTSTTATATDYPSANGNGASITSASVGALGVIAFIGGLFV